MKFRNRAIAELHVVIDQVIPQPLEDHAPVVGEAVILEHFRAFIQLAIQVDADRLVGHEPTDQTVVNIEPLKALGVCSLRERLGNPVFNLSVELRVLMFTMQYGHSHAIDGRKLRPTHPHHLEDVIRTKCGERLIPKRVQQLDCIDDFALRARTMRGVSQ